MIRPRSLLLLALLPWAAASAGCGGDEFESASGGGAGGGDGSADVTHPDASGGTGAGSGVDAADASDAQGDGPTSDAEPDSDVDQANELPLGEPCTEALQCASGHCTDGVCCEDECGGDCMTCAAPAKQGVCTPVPEGANPDGVCGPAGEPCSGSCDGAGSCAYPPPQDPCGPAICDPNGVDLVVPRCDGLGGCHPHVESCVPFACDTGAEACFASCEGVPEACVQEAYCDGTLCHAKLDVGEACGEPQMCLSGHCVDGVCCDGPCDGVCETCVAPGSEGTCQPYESGQDPEGECTGDGVCAGSCDGGSKCVFPDETTACGDAYCSASDNVQVQLLCDGAGACRNVPNDCGFFICEEAIGACLQSCATHGACVSEAYCDGGSCLEKKGDGVVCGYAFECSSGYCEVTSDLMRCCNTACPSPLDCVTGECLCQGMTCPAGEACVPWYQDLDGDEFGDPAAMSLGCEGTAPLDVNGNPFVRNMDDCFDQNAAAKPGQQEWFAGHRGDGSFDYDCDQKETKEFDDTVSAAAVCTDCKNWQCHNCGYLGYVYRTYGYACKVPDANDPSCGPSIWQSFKQNRPCGQMGTLYECDREIGQCTSDQTTKPNTMQRCR